MQHSAAMKVGNVLMIPIILIGLMGASVWRIAKTVWDDLYVPIIMLLAVMGFIACVYMASSYASFLQSMVLDRK